MKHVWVCFVVSGNWLKQEFQEPIMVVGYQTLKKGVSWSDNYGLVDFKIEEFSVWSVCLVKLEYYGF